MKLKGYEIITRSLKRAGAKTVFTIAGDHTLPLMDHMADEGFTFIDVRHEQAAVDMANAYGRITGRPGVTMFTTPGHANAIPGLTFAYHMETPVVNITGSATSAQVFKAFIIVSPSSVEYGCRPMHVTEAWISRPTGRRQ